MSDEHTDYRGFKTGKRKITNYRCYYKKEFPVDEYHRPGGMYSLVDLPVARAEIISRRGVVMAQNSQLQMYQIRDVEHPTWEYWVPMTDVSLGEIIDEND